MFSSSIRLRSVSNVILVQLHQPWEREYRIHDIHQTTQKLNDLEADTPYLIYIWAATTAGKGGETFWEDRTNPLSGKVLLQLNLFNCKLLQRLRLF
jgi:hypothetical protein